MMKRNTVWAFAIGTMALALPDPSSGQYAASNTVYLSPAKATSFQVFSGPREDDQPIFEASLTHIQEKNDHAGIESVGDLNVGPNEVVVRIYEGFGLQAYRRGGHPLTLFEIQQKQRNVRAVYYPPCPPGSEELLEDAEDLWEVLIEQDIFSVRDSRSFPDYPGILDGTSYIVQIKAEGLYREYYVNNPLEYSSPDNVRLLAVLSELRRQFGTPSCSMP